MAKTESTAVNDLINLVQSGQSRPIHDPSDDLFSTPHKPPRMTTTIPPMRGAGEVAPLPRTRTPSGTSQHQLPNIPPPNVRMSTAPVTRGQTIPPLNQTVRGTAPGPSPDFPRKQSASGLPAPIRQTNSQPVISNAVPLSVPSAPSRPNLPMPRHSQPIVARPASKPTLPMPNGGRMPAADPNDNPFAAIPAYPVVQHGDRPSRIDMTGDVVTAENWFESSRAVEKLEETFVGTAPVRKAKRPNETVVLIKKMIVPTVALVIVGIMIGGFIAFNGEGGKKAHAAKPAKVAEVTHVKAPVAPTVVQPAAESANAATATAGADQPEPPAATKAEPAAAQAEPAAAPAAKAEPVAVAKAEPAAVAAPAKAEPVAVAKAEPAAAPSIHEVQTTRGVVKLVDIRIDSKPSGATVMLVDNGKTNFLGTTPIATALDPARSYDVIFTIAGRPTQMTHIDPSKQTKLDVTLGKNGVVTQAVEAPKAAPAAPKAAPAVVATKAATPAPVHHHHAAAAAAAAKSAPTGTLADPGFDTEPAKTEAPKKVEAPKVEAPKAEPAAKKPVPAAAGSGTLMVSAKPPCEIWVDGKSTGLTTPQRSIPLPVGTHMITLQNSAQNITKTFAVTISADQSTKLVKDLLAP